MSGARNSIRQQQSSYVCNATWKTCTFCIDTDFVVSAWVIRDDCSIQSCISTSLKKTNLWLRQRGTEQTLWAEAWRWILGTTARGSNDRKQPAGSRSEIYEARSKMDLFGGKARETIEECHFLQFLSPSSDAYFPSCRSCVHHILTPPASSLPWIPPESCRQAFIYLIEAPGTVFHAQPCRSFSPSGEAVKLFIITRLSGMAEGHDCKAFEWNLGRTFVDRHAEFDNT